MNHEEATEYLDELGDRVSVRPPPVGEIIRAGKIAERRKSVRTLALIAAAAVLVVGGGGTVQQWRTDGKTGVDQSIASTPTGPATTPLPGEAPVSDGPCPPVPASTSDIDRSTVPAPDDAKGLTANDAGTAATWFEPESGRLPFLVVYDLVAGVELAREDLGVGEDLRSSSLRMDESALYYQSSADANVWLRYRWGVDDYPSVYVLCTG